MDTNLHLTEEQLKTLDELKATMQQTALLRPGGLSVLQRQPGAATSVGGSHLGNNCNSSGGGNNNRALLHPSTITPSPMATLGQTILGGFASTLESTQQAQQQAFQAKALRDERMRLELLAQVQLLNQQRQQTTALLPNQQRQAIDASDSSNRLLGFTRKASPLANIEPKKEGKEPPKKRLKYSPEKFDITKTRVLPKAAIKSSFPLPTFKETTTDSNTTTTTQKNKTQSTITKKPGKLTEFRTVWNRLEHFSDRMDDTDADQQAFVKEYFLRSLYKRRRGLIESKKK